ncbi:RNA polymerase sigma factor [Polyangium jinanense]|uniref:Sigma-70 family RNA polymerase sigma factor n=1 Tax=Polyangium jinanense TaxID=2829994 RepID=A0A9X3X2X7_9BACT|nr:sigma-70 family RNA polymerase sigma factor [Polyangium jinanense]MDC3952837.1 sigma-70 family RNA polymerase sigma factor [Polyangium jinanense]MDC3980456.1 sigma-70 family RNA polymerase sigma factor [Polyangium jinanense]
MEARKRDDLESEARILCERGDFEGAATVALKAYGAEVYTFLGARHQDRGEQDDVFAQFAEALWKSLPSFAWMSSLRTFVYAVARRTSLYHRREAHRRRQREAPLDGGSVVSRVAAAIRSATTPLERSEVKSRIAELRAELPEEDQELLVLRVDRQLSWLELAEVLRGEDEAPLEGEALKREAARLRKRFQLVKDALRERARREGLIPEDDDR